MKFLIIFVLAILLLQACAEASSFSTAANSLDNAYEENEVVNPHKYIHSHTIHCGKECGRRCKKALKEKRCKRACLACCHKCKCVPPGTYGNKELCPCYARLKTHGNKPKCP